jgi:metal transporter CNNM
MSRDLILTNIDNTLFTIRQLSSILVRDVIAIDHQMKLEPILTFFKKGGSHMAIVTRVHEEVGLDPTLQKIGIVTLEDIIEEILQEEIEDECEVQDHRGDRNKLRQKLVLAFSETKAEQVLN